VFGKRFIRHSIQFASPRIALDPLVEALSIKYLIPCAELVEVRWGELRYGFFDIFDSLHGCIDSMSAAADKPMADVNAHFTQPDAAPA
jgi:hypothetical protein